MDGWVGPVLIAVSLPCSITWAKCRPVQVSDIINVRAITGESALSALVQLGRQTNVCLGIEVTDLDLLSRPVSIVARNKALGSVMREVLQHSQRYDVSVEDAVVQVHTAGRSTIATQLDVVVPEYKTESLTVAEASLALLFRLKKLYDPSIGGFGGNYSDRFPEDKVLPIDEHGKTAREILTQVVTNSRSGAWIAGPCPMAELRTSGRTCWTILEYRDDPETLAKQIDNIVHDLTQRLERARLWHHFRGAFRVALNEVLEFYLLTACGFPIRNSTGS